MWFYELKDGFYKDDDLLKYSCYKASCYNLRVDDHNWDDKWSNGFFVLIQIKLIKGC